MFDRRRAAEQQNGILGTSLYKQVIPTEGVTKFNGNHCGTGESSNKTGSCMSWEKVRFERIGTNSWKTTADIAIPLQLRIWKPKRQSPLCFCATCISINEIKDRPFSFRNTLLRDLGSGQGSKTYAVREKLWVMTQDTILRYVPGPNA